QVMGTGAELGPLSSFFTRLFHGDRRALKTSLWMVAAAVFPFITAPIAQSFKLDTDWIIWILEGYFTLLIIGYVYKLSAVPVLVLKKGLGFFIFTIVIGIPLLVQAQQHWPLVKEIYSGTVKNDLSRGILGFVLGVGFFEELCKALPLLFFCVGRGPLR